MLDSVAPDAYPRGLLGRFWVLSMNVTIQDEQKSVGEAIVQAPDGSTLHVDWKAPGAYRFEEATFDPGPPPPVPVPSISAADLLRFHSSLLDSMPGLEEKWREWQASLPERV
jgi:hypothetical protein